MTATDRAASTTLDRYRDYMNTRSAFAKAAAAAQLQRLVEEIERRHGITIDPAIIDRRLAPINRVLDAWPLRPAPAE